MIGAVVWGAVAVALAAPGGPAGAEPRDKGDTAVEVRYDGAVLVVATPDGVAAFAFTDRVRLGTGYKFRFRPGDGGKEETGAGKVFERYKAVQGNGGPNDVTYVYDGGDLYLTAGPVKALWSRGDEKGGWVYFHPDRVQVHAVEGADLKTLDLRRFAK